MNNNLATSWMNLPSSNSYSTGGKKTPFAVPAVTPKPAAVGGTVPIKAPQYNYNTGKALASGEAQAQFNTQTGQAIVPDLAGVAPTNQPVNITTESLNPAVSNNVPQPGNTAGNTAQGIIGGAAGGMNTMQGLIDDYTKQIDTSNENLNSANPAIEALLGKLGGRSDMQNTLETNAGIPAARDLARGLTQEYQTKQLGYNQVLNSIYNQPGLTVSQRNSALETVSKQHAFDLTDLAIRQNIATGNYTALQDTIDKQVELQYGDVKDRLNYMMEFRKEFKDDLSKAEDRKANLIIKQLEKQDAIVEDLRKTKKDLLLSAGAQSAPADVISAISKATTSEEAISAAKEYAGDILERRQKEASIAASYASIRASNASAAKTLAELDGSGLNYTPSGLGEKVDAERLENYQTAKDAYGTLSTVTAKYGKTPDNWSWEDSKKLTDDDIKIISKNIPLIRNPSIKKQPNFSEIKESFNASTYAGLGFQVARNQFTGRDFSYEKVKESLNNAGTLFKERETELGIAKKDDGNNHSGIALPGKEPLGSYQGVTLPN